MKNKHMTKETRERIETGIRNNESLKDIAKALNKDSTTISKEVLKHRVDCVPEGQFISPTLCSKCSKYETCQLIKLCDLNGCSNQCRYCKRVNVPSKCNQYVKAICKRTSRFPYVCNGCSKRRKCRLQKYEYDPLFAEREYKKLLKESRKGFNLSKEEFDEIDKILKDGNDKGQSINHILSSNPKLIISIKTAYNYVNSGCFQVKQNDLPNYANHILKKRVSIPKEYEYQENKDMNRKGREYCDYLLYVDANNIVYHTELDCVGITKDYVGALLTVIIPKWSFLLLYKVIYGRSKKSKI